MCTFYVDVNKIGTGFTLGVGAVGRPPSVHHLQPDALCHCRPPSKKSLQFNRSLRMSSLVMQIW